MKLCKDFTDRIIDFLENNISAQERKIISEHLKYCSACRKEYEKIKALYGILNEDTVPLPDKERFDRIRDKVRQRELRLYRFKIPRFVKVLVPVFAAVLLILILFRPEKTIDISVPTSVLLEDETIAKRSLSGILNDQLIKDFIIIEEDLPFDIDETIAEFSDEEKSDFINILYEELNRLQEDV